LLQTKAGCWRCSAIKGRPINGVVCNFDLIHKTRNIIVNEGFIFLLGKMFYSGMKGQVKNSAL